MSGDTRLYEPGRHVSVEVVANANGNVAERGQVVEIVGQTPDSVQVALSTTAGAGVGHLARTPLEYDETATYAAGDVVGESKVYLTGPVDKFETTELATLATGDQVVTAAGGGVREYDPVDTGADDQPQDIFGRVWTTRSHSEGGVGKVAVYRHR